MAAVESLNGVAEAGAGAGAGADSAVADSKSVKGRTPNIINCDYCRRDITNLIHIKCAECSDIELCLDCYALGIEIAPHIKTHAYNVKAAITIPLFDPEWSAMEELVLLDGIEQFGFGNWTDIAELIGNDKTKQKVESHYNECYVYSKSNVPFMPDIENTLDKPGVKFERNMVPLSDSELKYRASLQQHNAYNQFATQAKQQTIQAIEQQSPSPSPTPSTNDTVHPTTAEHKTPSAQAYIVSGFGNVPHSGTSESLSSQLSAATPATKRRMSKNASQHKLSSARGTGLVGSQAVKPPKARGKGLLVGWQEKRGDFDTEYMNNAELIIADMEFSDLDSERDRAIKLDVLTVYNSVLDDRAERKRFILERGLLERREKKRSKVERDVYNAYRPFARFHSAEQHEVLVQGILKEQMLRQRIQQLQHYRTMGIRTLAEAELYEAEKRKRDAAISMKSQARHQLDISTSKRPNTSKRNAQIDVTVDASDSTINNNNKSSLHDAANSIKRGSHHHDSSETPFDCSTMDGANTLKPSEIELCNMLHLEPQHYNQIKAKICTELHNRDLYKNGTGHKLLRIDINKQDKVLDFMIEAGWLNTQSMFGSQQQTPYDLSVRDENGVLINTDTEMKL